MSTEKKKPIFRLIEPKTPEELEKYYNLRYEVLRKPWNQPPTSTKDDWEHESIHILLLDEVGHALATGRLQFISDAEGQIRSMAVREDMRRHGIGKQILQYIEKRARERKLKHLVLDARDHAVDFYKKNGYEVIGESYILFDVIPHLKMFKSLE